MSVYLVKGWFFAEVDLSTVKHNWCVNMFNMISAAGHADMI